MELCVFQGGNETEEKEGYRIQREREGPFTFSRLGTGRGPDAHLPLQFCRIVSRNISLLATLL